MPHVILDPPRIAAQFISGIGFLGAESIPLRGTSAMVTLWRATDPDTAAPFVRRTNVGLYAI
jgi:hypothetical protein